MTRSKSRFNRSTGQRSRTQTAEPTVQRNIKLTPEQIAQDQSDAKKFIIILISIVVIILITIYFLFFRNF